MRNLKYDNDLIYKKRDRSGPWREDLWLPGEGERSGMDREFRAGGYKMLHLE